MTTTRWHNIGAALFLIALLAGGCEKPWVPGQKENVPPETHLMVDTIARSGNERLQTSVSLSWWGDDPDGFVTAYQWRIDNTTEWHLTRATDTTFLFDLPPGADTADIIFRVRSIDDAGAPDPTPARLRIPLRNSPPEVTLTYPRSTGNQKVPYPSYSFPVWVLTWEAADPDGIDQLDSFRLYLNSLDSPYVALPPTVRSLTLEAVHPREDRSTCRLYLGNDETPYRTAVLSMHLDDTNRAILVAVDDVGTTSAPDTSRPIYLRKVTAPYLWVNGFTSFFDYHDNRWRGWLATQGLQNVPVLRLAETEGNYYRQLQPTNFAQALVFGMFDYIFWAGNDLDRSLSLVQKSLGRFLAAGGKIFQAVPFPYDADPRAGYFELMPLDSLVAADGTFTLDKNARLHPLSPGWPVLGSSRIVSSARPFYPHPSATPLYAADLVVIKDFQSTPWTGPAHVMARRTYPSGAIYIFSSVLPQHLDRLGNIDSLFDRIVHDEFQIP